MKYLLFAGLLFLQNIAFSVSKSNWILKDSKIEFVIKNAKINVNGNFTDLIADINFDSKNLTSSFFEAQILVNTIKTGIKLRDTHLQKSEYFDEKKFPKINIKSSEIIKNEKGQLIAKCTLTIKGKTKDVLLPFTFTENNQNGFFKGKLNINRLDFDLGSPSIIMSNGLEINIEVVCEKK